MIRDAQTLVTGGTGFIGRYVVRQLRQRGESVRVFCRDAAKARRLFGADAGVEFVVGDLCDPGSVARACRGVQRVIHAGGAFQFGRRARHLMMDSNVRGTEMLLDAAINARVTCFVHVSSSSQFVGGGGLLTERDLAATVSTYEPYRRSKWLAEQAVMAAAQRGLPVCIANPASPIGPEDELPTPTGQIIRDFLLRKFPAVARVALNFIDVGDLAAGIVAVADRGRVGERYILGAHNVWLDDFLRMLADATGLPAPERRVPMMLLSIAGLMGELAGSDRVCWESTAHARRQQWFDCRKAREELGWSPDVPLEASARAAIDWCRHELSVPQEQWEADVVVR